MYGLTIRWSLMDAPPGTADSLRDYVVSESKERFTGMPGLHQKTWQIAEHGFFSGVYVWATEQARARFLEDFRANPSRVSQLVGHGPDVIQEWELLAVAVGAEGPLAP
jgi:predicted secreted protein